MTEIGIGSRVRSTSGYDWDAEWQDCTVIDTPSSAGYMNVMRASDGRVGLLRNDQMELLPTAPNTPAGYSDEVVGRAMALVRRMAPINHVWQRQDYEEARAIVALLPEPVDPDEQYARDMIREQGWLGVGEIGGQAVLRMIAAAHRAGRALAAEGR